MKCNFILKIKDINIIDMNNNKILELFKLSVENNINNLNYNKNIKNSSHKNLEIIYYKQYTKKNIGKMIYNQTGKNNTIQIFHKKFISNSIKMSKIIINNKQYELKENIETKKNKLKIKIKFLDNILFLDSMFRNCKSISSIYNFQTLKIKYLKTIHNLFDKCSSLLFIDDISNWNTNSINN